MKPRLAAAGLVVCAAVGTQASATAVRLTAPSEFEHSMLMLTDIAMAITHGPTSGEGVGLLRYDTGLYPPATIDLNLPELRGASPLEALRWSNRWREVIESVYGGDREMVDYWTQGAAAQSEPVFSVLRIGQAFLNSDGARRQAPAMQELESTTGYASAMKFARGGGAGGGGGSGGGNPQALLGVVTPNEVTPPPPSGSGPHIPPSAGQPETPNAANPPRGFTISIDGLDWVNPNFNQNPPPVDSQGDKGSPQGPTSGSPVPIPTPTALGLGAAGLLVLAAGARRRRFA